MKSNFRVNLVDKLIDFNEKLIFFPALKRAYKSNLSSINTVLDIGANKGQTIDFFLKLNPNCTIYAFEPNLKLFNLLKKKYAAYPKVKLFNLGVSDTTGKLLFHENIFDQTSTFEEINYDSAYLKKKSKVLGVKPEEIFVDSYEVGVVTLYDFIKEHIKGDIDVLKIDTEGHEYKCLLGLFNQGKLPVKIKLMQLEYHYDDMYANKITDAQITDLLNQNGYFEERKVKHGFGDFDEVIFKYKD